MTQINLGTWGRTIRLTKLYTSVEIHADKDCYGCRPLWGNYRFNYTIRWDAPYSSKCSCVSWRIYFIAEIALRYFYVKHATNQARQCKLAPANVAWAKINHININMNQTFVYFFMQEDYIYLPETLYRPKYG